MTFKRRTLPFEQYRELKERNYQACRKRLAKEVRVDKFQVKKAVEVLAKLAKSRAEEDALGMDD